MQIDAIRTFLAVIRLGSLSQAAEDLNVTQSTVSARLDSLESVLRQKLINRSKKGATLTAAGTVFQPHAQAIDENWRLTLQKLILPRGTSMMFTFGCSFDLWTNLGDWLYGSARAASASTAFQVKCGSTPEVVRSLESGLTDVILVPMHVSRQDFRCEAVFRDELVQVSTTDRSVMKWDPDYIRINYDQVFDEQHLRHWPDDNIAQVTVDSPEWGLGLLLAQGGSAYLPIRLARPYLDDGRLFPVRDSPVFERDCFLIWRNSRAEEMPQIALLRDGAARAQHPA